MFGFLGNIVKGGAVALVLVGCASTVIMPDGSKMSEAVYAHRLSIEAYETRANQATSCDAAAAGIGDALGRVAALLACGQRVAGGNTSQVPTYQAPPTFIDRVVQLAPVALGLGQLVASDRANARQTQASVDIAGIGAARELGIVQAATGSNERIATGGFNAVGNVAGAGFVALGNAATSANYAGTANVQALAGMVANLPPTTQIIAGRDVIQARDVDQSTSRNRITGDGNETERNVNCVAQGGNGAPATAGNSAATGTTSPFTAGYSPLISGGDGAQGANNCGGG